MRILNIVFPFVSLILGACSTNDVSNFKSQNPKLASSTVSASNVDRNIASMASLDIPKFNIKLDGNSYTDLSAYTFHGFTGGEKSGGIMYWEYSDKDQEITKVDDKNYVAKSISRGLYPLTGEARVFYKLKLGLKAYPEYDFVTFGIGSTNLGLENDRLNSFINKFEHSLFVTTLPLPKVVPIKTEITLNDKPVVLNTKDGDGCVYIIEIVAKLSNPEAENKRRTVYLRWGETKPEYRDGIMYIKTDRRIPLAFVSFEKPSGIKYYLNLEIKLDGKNQHLLSQEFEVSDLNNIDMEKDLENLEFHIDNTNF